MTRALVLHHDAESTTGLLGGLLTDRHVEVVEHWICGTPRSAEATGPLPDATDVDLVIALGSRWSIATDGDLRWINEELRLLARLHTGRVPILGICFGGQALAAALGGTVERAPRPEIGWHLVDSSSDRVAAGPWFQWHLDRFSVPPGATQLAASPVGPQAFRLDRSLGVQFHPELDVDLLQRWIATDRDELTAHGVDPEALVAETAARVEDARNRTAALLDVFLTEIAGA